MFIQCHTQIHSWMNYDLLSPLYEHAYMFNPHDVKDDKANCPIYAPVAKPDIQNQTQDHLLASDTSKVKYISNTDF